MNENANFWLGEVEDFEKLRKTDNLQYLLRLSSYKNSISNFVRIMTGRNDIKVKFNAQNKSFTDGRVVVIGSDMSNGNIDPSVGVALHESAHIVKTDMDYFRTFWQKIPPHVTKIGVSKKYNAAQMSELSTDMLNYVEDRYIDNWAYTTAPGYQGYYDKMYEKYWHNPIISDGLRSCFFRSLNLESYRFRVINMTNSKSDLDALPGLREIYDIIDFKNIDRLDTQLKRGKIATEVTRIIIENLGENMELDFLSSLPKPDPIKGDVPKPEDEKKEDSEDEKSETEEEDSNESGEGEDDSDDDSDEDTCESENGASGEGTPEEDENEAPKDLKDQIQEQLDFLKGTTSKSELTEKESEIVETIEKSETTLSPAGGTDGVPIIPCIVVKKVNRDVLDSGIVPMSMGGNPSEDAVQKGIVMGTMLGKKLQIRGEVKSTKFNRLLRGKIDKRLLSGLGYNNANVFYNVNVDEYKKAHIHISVDASQSMTNDEKWDQVMICTVAICKAASMIQNISVCVTFRSTSYRQGQSNVPIVVVAYDSRIDKFTKVTQLFPSFCPNGATPEGLSFQSILNLIPKATHELDVYFLNFSDGGPCYAYNGFTYMGKVAGRHTKRQVDKIKSSGSEVLSYFVGKDEESNELFKLMYGTSANFVNVTDVSSIAKSLNDKFLQKSNE